MQQKENSRQQWFLDRIGKVIYRNNYCPCNVCEHIYLNGILLLDKDHAIYCYENECCFTADGDPMQYFDTREEMLEFEATLKQK
jgi:hypothetical protein